MTGPSEHERSSYSVIQHNRHLKRSRDRRQYAARIRRRDLTNINGTGSKIVDAAVVFDNLGSPRCQGTLFPGRRFMLGGPSSRSDNSGVVSPALQGLGERDRAWDG